MDENLRLLKSDPPEEIVFEGPHEKGSQSKLNLTNPGKETVYFKVLTTDPMAFCVKPKMGRVLAGETTQVCITLRNDDPKYYLEKQPKFKILTIENSDTDQDPKSLWNGDKVDSMSSLRFSCNFLDLEKFCDTTQSEIDRAENKRNSEETRTTEYDTSGSSMSLKEGPSSKKSVRGKFFKIFQFKHIILSVVAVLIAYAAATSMFRVEPVSV